MKKTKKGEAVSVALWKTIKELEDTLNLLRTNRPMSQDALNAEYGINTALESLRDVVEFYTTFI